MSRNIALDNAKNNVLANAHGTWGQWKDNFNHIYSNPNTVTMDCIATISALLDKHFDNECDKIAKLIELDDRSCIPMINALAIYSLRLPASLGVRIVRGLIKVTISAKPVIPNPIKGDIMKLDTWNKLLAAWTGVAF